MLIWGDDNNFIYIYFRRIEALMFCLRHGVVCKHGVDKTQGVLDYDYQSHVGYRTRDMQCLKLASLSF